MSTLARAAGSGLEVLRRRGPSYGLYLLGGYLWPRWRYRLLGGLSPRRLALAATCAPAALGLAATVVLLPLAGATRSLAAGAVIGLGAAAPVPIRRFRHRRRLLAVARGQTGGATGSTTGGSAADLPPWTEWPLDDPVRQAVAAARRTGETVELGRIDADGRLLSPFGAFPGFESVDQLSFLRRDRYDLDLVLQGERPAVRKDYRGDRKAFRREWLALIRLAGAANVPAVLAADEPACRLTRSLLPGETVNDLLVRRGARIRLAQTAGDPELEGLTAGERLAAVLARGTERLRECLPEGFFERLRDQVEAIHRRGITGFSLTFGNVMVAPDGETPWLFDFDGCRLHPSTNGFAFALERDHDRRLLARLYGLELVTEASARRMLAEGFASSYAPVDLGAGLATRGFWSVDSGTGRWQYLNGPVLADLLPGKRVLDLGSHNGVLPLMMLRRGASQVVAVEQSQEAAADARRLQQMVEWRDLASYDLDIRRRDMRAVLEEEWGRFDLITAFCSLYYLEEEDMARVVRRAAELAPILVLQAKSDTRRDAAAGKAAKSSPDFLRRLLVENGFPRVEVHAPPGYSRPLLVGRRS